MGLHVEVSKSTPLRPAMQLRELGEVGDAGVRDDQRRLRVAVDERAQAVGDRRQAAAAVDQDRHAVLGGDLEDRREPLVAGGELLGARVQLDAARAGSEAAARLLERRLVQVEPQERDQPPVRALGERERPVVRGAERRVPVGLVEAEHEGARDAVAAPSAARAGRSRRPCRRCRARGAGGRRRCRRPSGSRRRSSSSQRATSSSSALLRASIVGSLVRVRAMPDVLMYADTFRSPELRHEVPLGVPDPFLYVEQDGVKHIAIGSMEIPRLAALGLFELHPDEEYGARRPDRRGHVVRRGQAARSPLRAVKALGVTSAVVPETFPLWLADKLRAEGVELTVDGEFFDERRRVKTEAAARRHAPRPARRRGRDGRRARPAAPRRAERRRARSSTASR